MQGNMDVDNEGKGLSIEESIRAAMGEVEGGEEEDIETSTAAPQAEESQTEASEGSEIAPEAQVEEVGEETATPAGDVAVPQFLDDKERDEFSKIPESHRPFVESFIRRRDLAYQRFVSRVRMEAQNVIQEHVAPIQPIAEVVGAHMQRLQLDGKDLVTAIRSTLAWDQRIDEHPVDAIAQLCQRKGVHPREVYDYLYGDGNGGGNAPAYNGAQGRSGPRESEFEQRLASLEEENAALKAQAQKSPFESAIAQFSSARGTSGELLHPYFDDVRSQMKPLIMHLGALNPQEDAQTLLTKAYSQACWANENVRALMLQTERTKKAVVGLEKKKAATSIKTASNGSTAAAGRTPQGNKMTIEDSIRWAAAQEGVELD